jgi:histidinol phosphatase-like PHP family hydrolase
MPRDCFEPYQKHVDYMIQAYLDIINSKVNKYITAVAHPFEAVCCPYDNEILINMISDDTFKRLFDETAEKGIAFEINVASMHKKNHFEIENSAVLRMFRLAKECGCQFIFGSDAHSNSAHESYSNAQFVADLLGLTENDIKDI